MTVFHSIKHFPLVIFGDELEGVARLCGHEALESDEGGAAGSGHFEEGAVVIGATQPHLETNKTGQMNFRPLRF